MQTRTHHNVSKVKVVLPGMPAGSGYLIELRRDGVHIHYQPGKGRWHKTEPERVLTLERLVGLKAIPSDKDTYGTPAEECEACGADMKDQRAELLNGIQDAVGIAARREQLRRTERVLGKV